jgi:hypothetical protein
MEVSTLVSAPTIVVADPLSRVEIALMGDDLPLPEPGRYVLRLRMNGRHVQDYVIIASEAP